MIGALDRAALARLTFPAGSYSRKIAPALSPPLRAPNPFTNPLLDVAVGTESTDDSRNHSGINSNDPGLADQNPSPLLFVVPIVGSPRSRRSTVARLRRAENRPFRSRSTAAPIAIRASAAAVDSSTCFLISTLLLRELSRNQVSKKTLGRRTASLSDRHSG